LKLFGKVRTLALTHPQGFMSGALPLMLLEESIRPMQGAVALRPDFANVWGGLGLACHKLGRHQEAVAYWERAKLLRPSFLTENPAYQPMYDESLAKAGPQPAAPLP
jgi:tetratricopeptide (TPR) repeat protein